MALLNYLIPGSYTIISDLAYVKSNRAMEVVLSTYSDQTKTNRLFYKPITIGDGYVHPLTGRGLTEPPDSVRPGDCFLTASTGCSGPWLDRENLLARWDGREWVFQRVVGHEFFYDESSGKYVQLQSDFSLKPVETYRDFRIWNKWFNFQDTELDTFKQIYRFLKAEIASFQNCIDA